MTTIDRRVEQDALGELLVDFQRRAMKSAPVRKLLTGWDRVIEIRTLGPDIRTYVLRSSNGALDEPTRSAGARADVVILATDAVLQAIFGGTLNPARAHLDGDLVAQGSQRDQLVLDSLVLLIWGL